MNLKPSKLKIIFANTIIVFGILLSIIFINYAIHKIINIPEHIVNTFYFKIFYFTNILLGVILATLFGFLLKSNNALKIKLSSFFIIIIICIYFYEIYLEFNHSKLSESYLTTHPGKGWILVNATELTPEAIIKAMEQGSFYATTGIQLEEIAVSQEKIKITIQTEWGVNYKTQFIGTSRNFDQSSKQVFNADGTSAHISNIYSNEIGQILLETKENPAVYKFTGDELYVRAKIISNRKHPYPLIEEEFETAWTQPVVKPEAMKLNTDNIWYKGNLHTHTLWSDGNAPPETIVSWYKNHGYNFLALSDHNIMLTGEKWVQIDNHNKVSYEKMSIFEKFGERLLIIVDKLLSKQQSLFNNQLVKDELYDEQQHVLMRLKTYEELKKYFNETNKFILIQGEEITNTFENLPVHVNATNLETLIPPQIGQSTYEVLQRSIDAVRKQSNETGRPMIAHVPHPNYDYAITVEDLIRLKGDSFFEIFNGIMHSSDLGDKLHPITDRMWDIALSMRLIQEKEPLYGIAVDDSHQYEKWTIHRSGHAVNAHIHERYIYKQYVDVIVRILNLHNTRRIKLFNFFIS